MENGYVLRLKLYEGFGFIRSQGHGEDVFFHATRLRGGLEFDESLVERFVRFETETTARGIRALEVWPA